MNIAVLNCIDYTPRPIPHTLPSRDVFNPSENCHIIGHGIDIVNVRRVKELVEQTGECFEWQCLTATERHTSGLRTHRMQYLASRLAAKKAVLKAIRRDGEQPAPWREIEIQRLPTGEPAIMLYGNCQEIAAKLGVAKWLLSISHTPSYAAASAIALRAGGKASQSSCD